LLQQNPSTNTQKKEHNIRTLYPSLKSWMLFAFGTFRAILPVEVPQLTANAKANHVVPSGPVIPKVPQPRRDFFLLTAFLLVFLVESVFLRRTGGMGLITPSQVRKCCARNKSGDQY
jgi:hypothetical protein